MGAANRVDYSSTHPRPRSFGTAHNVRLLNYLLIHFLYAAVLSSVDLGVWVDNRLTIHVHIRGVACRNLI